MAMLIGTGSFGLLRGRPLGDHHRPTQLDLDGVLWAYCVAAVEPPAKRDQDYRAEQCGQTSGRALFSRRLGRLVLAPARSSALRSDGPVQTPMLDGRQFGMSSVKILFPQRPSSTSVRSWGNCYREIVSGDRGRVFNQGSPTA